MYHQATTSGTHTTVCKPLDWSDRPFRMNYHPSKRPCPVHALRTYEGGVQVGWGASMFLDKRNYIGSAGIRAPNRPARILAATQLSQLAADNNAMKLPAQNGTVSSVGHVTLTVSSVGHVTLTVSSVGHVTLTAHSSREQRYCIDIL